MASKPAFRIPTFYLPVADFRQWLAAAAVGASVEYAFGPALDPNEATARAVADAISAGQVECFKHRKADGSLAHIARRKQAVAKQLVVKRIKRDEDYEASDEGRLFLMLVRLANVGLPCPTYPEMAERLGLRDFQAARYLFQKLAKAGKILVNTSNSGMRMVTIVQTGARTASKG